MTQRRFLNPQREEQSTKLNDSSLRNGFELQTLFAVASECCFDVCVCVLHCGTPLPATSLEVEKSVHRLCNGPQGSVCDNVRSLLLHACALQSAVTGSSQKKKTSSKST
eukprot:2178589-Amphidinium_carterae.1